METRPEVACAARPTLPQAAAAALTHPALSGATASVIRGYTLLELLGVGNVYLGRMVPMGRCGALKELPPCKTRNIHGTNNEAVKRVMTPTRTGTWMRRRMTRRK